MADSKLTVEIGSEVINVEVSPGGMFYDKDTKKVSAKTLKGLEKKLQEMRKPTGGIPVENWHDGKHGVVTGRVKTKGWRRHYVYVRWADNTVTEESPGSLCPPLPLGVRDETHRLEKAQEKTRANWEAAGVQLSKHRAKYSIEETLNTAFPTR